MDDLTPPRSPVQEGDILAKKYRVEKVLGVGGMGVVVAATHVELDERVALKFLLPSAAQSPSVVARFNREARAAVKIKSRHVARVSDVGTLDNGTPYIVMEYLEGKDLGAILEEKQRLPVGTAVDYVLEALEAIAEAHASGIVHRDLKPPNLFLARQSDGTSIIKVLDFGISKAVLADEPSGNSGLTGTTDVFGSPTYMSPEQLKASRDVDARTDVWALGVILYELMAGKAPFERPTVAETFGSILYEKPMPLSEVCRDVPAELNRIVMRCLEKDVAARTPNVAELAKALFPFAAHGSQESLERTSRILRRAGMAKESIPPDTLGSPARTSIDSGRAASPGSQTRSAWGTAGQIQRPGGSRATVLIGVVAGMLVAGGVGFFALRRLGPATVVVPMQADRPVPAATGAPTTPDAPVTAVVAPANEAPPVATGVAAPPSATAVTVAPTASPVTTAPGASTAGRKGSRPGAKHSPPGAPAPTDAPATPKPRAPEGDDFLDRK